MAKSSRAHSIGGKVSGDANVVVAKGGGEVSATRKWGDGTSEQTDVAVDYLQLLIRELANSELVVFIDDFHYIPRAVQVEVSNQIKEAIRNNVNFVVASVPYHSDDAIRANPDLRGRTIKLDFDYWKPDELCKIANRGFAALYSSTVAKMKDGPKTRGQDRKAYLMRDGAVLDVYPLILRAIANDPPQLTLRYPNLQRRIQSLCANDQPSGSSVTGASSSGTARTMCSTSATLTFFSSCAGTIDSLRSRPCSQRGRLRTQTRGTLLVGLGIGFKTRGAVAQQFQLFAHAQMGLLLSDLLSEC